jgi:hypothetical protein
LKFGFECLQAENHRLKSGNPDSKQQKLSIPN